MATLKVPDLTPQNAPFLEDRGDPALPPLMHRTWWLNCDAARVAQKAMAVAVDALQTTLAHFTSQQGLRRTQSQLATLAATLAGADAGVLVEVTDFRHVLRWSGSAWTWGPGEDGRHDIVGLPLDPDDATGWQLCDGTTVSYLKGDGTTANFTTPDLTSAANKAAYLKLGTPVSGPTAAIAPAFTGMPITPTGTVSAIAAGTGAVNVLTSSVTSVSTAAHTHPAPTFTGNALTPAGTVDATGEPRNYELRPWFRR